MAIKVDLRRSARQSLSGAFPALTYSELGISKSYYYKLKKSLQFDEYLPKKIVNKVLKLYYEKNNKIYLYNHSRLTVKVSDYAKKKLQKSDKEYIWVKFQLYTKGRKYWQSFTILKNDINRLEKAVNDYIKVMIKKYDQYPVQILSLTFQNV